MLTLRIIILLTLNLQPIEVENFLRLKGLKNPRVEMINLAIPLIKGQELNYFHSLNAAFNYAGNKMILTAPFIKNGQEWISGFTQGKTSTCVFNEFNEKGQPRKLHSLICMAHEVAHICKLSHTKGCISITDEAAMACPNIETLGFLPDELKRLNRCK